ncbi:MAG: transcription antitermination factor NusB [Clostridiales Family XIII bacterium]|jgi:N utilization substance protein B|nr:transcription antitermination factor NusB [Clostridiales Family XIII bacterium]
MYKTAPKKHSTFRKKTRELLMRLIFQCTASHDFSEEAKERFLEDETMMDGLFSSESDEHPDLIYFNYGFASLLEHLEEIDETIASASEKWAIGRMNAVDLAILRLAGAEILFLDDISDRISANEAVVMAKRYGTDKSPAFINGIIGSIVRKKEEGIGGPI